MVIVISPAKSLDFENKACTELYSEPAFLEQSADLIQTLRALSKEELGQLMRISDKLAELNHDRNANWQPPFSPANAKQAVLAFKGDVYVGLAAETFTQADYDFAQQHLRILSGLYGLLKPLDLIQAYRLEMGTKLKNGKGKNLYEFWGTSITDEINALLEKQSNPTLINLASNEYFKVIKPKLLKAKVITPIFKDYKNGKLKVISFFAKKARGWMSSFIIKNQLTDPEALKTFNVEGYTFDANLSSDKEWIFTR